MNGDEKAWNTMKKYARQDVDLLADLYYRLRPWMTTHPNLALFDGRPDSCPTCGHADLMRRGYRSTKVAQYAQFQCKKCKAYCRKRVKSDATSPNLVP